MEQDQLRMKFTEEKIAELNRQFRDRSPAEIIEWAISIAERPVITTNFRPYEAAILYACARVKPDIDVLWCDTGYNTPQTYRCAKKIIGQLGLNIDIFVPKLTAAYRDVVMGIPQVNDPLHAEFSEQVKLEPFRRAMTQYKPDVWFTNLRQGQTEFRNLLDILSLSKDGILKISPFYYYSDSELDFYLETYDLPNEHRYFDPTKAISDRECGIHIN